MRHHWGSVKAQLIRDLRDESFQFSPMSRITKANGDTFHIWCAIDALVLKALAAVLADVLPLALEA